MMEEQQSTSKEQLKKFTVAICKPGYPIPAGIKGTGFIVNSEGLILTCFHVVGDRANNQFSYDNFDIYFPEANITKRAVVSKELSCALKDVAFLTLEEPMPSSANIAIASL